MPEKRNKKKFTCLDKISHDNSSDSDTPVSEEVRSEFRHLLQAFRPPTFHSLPPDMGR